jgi:hypothetical protein
MDILKRFIDRVSLMDSRNSRDLVLSADEARKLRDEIAKLLVDRASNTVVEEVTVRGGRF